LHHTRTPAVNRAQGKLMDGEHLSRTYPYLDANGTVFHRPGLFHGRVVLDQGWALEAIYAVFDRVGGIHPASIAWHI